MKKILKLLVVSLVVFLCLDNVRATENQLDGIILATNDFGTVLDGTVYLEDNTLENANTYIKVTTDNELVYCTDADEKIWVNEGNKDFKKCAYVSGKKGRILSYVLENGYSGIKKESGYTVTKYLTGDMRKDYYITQSAVWYHTEPKSWMTSTIFNLTNSTINNKTNDIIKKMTSLINDAEKAGEGAKLSINVANTKMVLSTDKKYLISNEIKLSGTYLNSNITATLSGADGAFVTTDKNATSGTTTFSNNSTVYIKIPVEKITKDETSITLNVAATTYISENSVIECENSEDDPGVQPLARYTTKNTNVSNSTSVSITKYPVKITKKDITDSEEIEGATLTIKNSSGTVVDTWVSTTEAKSINLLPDTYTLEETIAPDGYIKNTSKIKFTVDERGKVLIGGKEVSEVVIINEPIIVTISKRSITKKDELKGATLRITDLDGNIATDVSGKKLEWVSEDKSKTFNLKMGDYILSETIAPEGYELRETTIKFTVNGEGKVLIDGKEVEDNLIIFENTPEPKQVPTGNAIIYVAGTMCIAALGVAIYYIIKRKEL